MKIVKVTYAAKPAFAAQNSINIKNVMNDLRQLNNQAFFIMRVTARRVMCSSTTLSLNQKMSIKYLTPSLPFYTFNSNLKLSVLKAHQIRNH